MKKNLLIPSIIVIFILSISTYGKLLGINKEKEEARYQEKIAEEALILNHEEEEFFDNLYNGITDILKKYEEIKEVNLNNNKSYYSEEQYSAFIIPYIELFEDLRGLSPDIINDFNTIALEMDNLELFYKDLGTPENKDIEYIKMIYSQSLRDKKALKKEKEQLHKDTETRELNQQYSKLIFEINDLLSEYKHGFKQTDNDVIELNNQRDTFNKKFDAFEPIYTRALEEDDVEKLVLLSVEIDALTEQFEQLQEKSKITKQKIAINNELVAMFPRIEEGFKENNLIELQNISEEVQIIREKLADFYD